MWQPATIFLRKSRKSRFPFRETTRKGHFEINQQYIFAVKILSILLLVQASTYLLIILIFWKIRFPTKKRFITLFTITFYSFYFENIFVHLIGIKLRPSPSPYSSYSFFKKNGRIPASFGLFSLFSHYNFQ